MSSNLTSVSINKNKSRFAPKVKARPSTSKRTQVNDASTSSPSSSTSTVKSSLPSTDTLDLTSIVPTAAKVLVDPSLHPCGKMEETLRQLSSSTIPNVANAADHLETTTTTTAKRVVKRRLSKTPSSGTPIVIGTPSSSTNENRQSILKIESANTPSTPIPGVMESASLTKKQKLMKNIKDAMKKSDKTPSPISTPAKPATGHAFAAPSNTTPTVSAATPARRRRAQFVNQGNNVDDEADYVGNIDELDEESEPEYTDININASEEYRKRKQDKARKTASRKKKEVLLAKDMKTLDDLTKDPLQPEDLDRDIKYFLKDLPRGVVTKQFRDEQIQREQEMAALKNDQDALGRLAAQKEALQLQKEKDEEAARVKKAQEEDELRKKQQQQQQAGLSESNHALQVRMVNGQIVLDTDSMMIDRNKDREEISHEHMEVVEENAQSHKINSKTYGKNTGNKRWSREETDLFYDLLSQFGTDFEMMAQMIPDRSRVQVRLKYNKEQRTNPGKVTEYMIRKKKPLDLEAFKEKTGLEFENVPDHFHTLQLV